MYKIQLKFLRVLISFIYGKDTIYISGIICDPRIICRLGSFAGLDSTSMHPGTELRESQMIGPLKEKG